MQAVIHLTTKCTNLTTPQMDQLLSLSYKVHLILDQLGVGALIGNALETSY